MDLMVSTSAFFVERLFRYVRSADRRPGVKRFQTVPNAPVSMSLTGSCFDGCSPWRRTQGSPSRHDNRPELFPAAKSGVGLTTYPAILFSASDHSSQRELRGLWSAEEQLAASQR